MSAAAGEDPSQREDVVSQILPPQRRKSAETEPGAFTVRQQVLAKRFERSALFSADPCGDTSLARPTAKSPVAFAHGAKPHVPKTYDNKTGTVGWNPEIWKKIVEAFIKS